MNLFRSLRFKAVLASVSTSTLVLLVFGALAFWQMRENRLLSLDKELKELGQFVSLMARWELSSDQLQRIIKQRVGEDRALGCIYAVQQKTVPRFQSANWPDDLRVEAHPPSSQIVTFDFDLMGMGGGPPMPVMGPGPGKGKGHDHRSKEPPPDALGNPLDLFGGLLDKGPAQPPNDDHGMPPQPTLYAPVTRTVTSAGHVFRLGIFGHAESGTIIHLGFDLKVYASDLISLENSFWLALPLAMVVIAGGAWLTALRSLVPVQRLTREMQSLSPANLHSRLDATGADDEFHAIIGAYNTMLARLEKSFQQASRFSADASHELKTPLAVMRATLEQALRRSADGSQEQRTYAGLLDETDHLQSIIEALLLLSRADAGKLTLSAERLDLVTWLRPMIEDAGLMAEARHITVHEDLIATGTVAADPVLLQRAVHNLLRNAVAYNEDNGHLWCATRMTPGHVRLIISNTGPAIPDAERAHIFERFARGSNVGGTGEGRGLGIGLSLAREIVLTHGGTLELSDEGPGSTTLVLTLPV